jgi:hypothetical protein
MNELTRQQLQIAVERAVRPVRVGWWRRDRMREELLRQEAWEGRT